LFVWLIFLGTAYDFLLRRVWGRWRMSVIQRQLRDHVVIAGFGNSGSEAASELIRRGAHPDTIVVIDESAAALRHAEALDVAVMEGNATRDAALKAARLGTARALIVAAGRDDTSILIVLTARRIVPTLPISVVIRSLDNEAIAKQAGANTVINPASFAGLLLAGSTHGIHLADYMADLAATDGRVSLRERCVTAAEIGIPLRAIDTGLGHRIYRNGTMIGFWEPAANRLEAGDVILEVVPAPGPDTDGPS
jgi:voltage-gated potassium channel